MNHAAVFNATIIVILLSTIAALSCLAGVALGWHLRGRSLATTLELRSQSCTANPSPAHQAEQGHLSPETKTRASDESSEATSGFTGIAARVLLPGESISQPPAFQQPDPPLEQQIVALYNAGGQALDEKFAPVKHLNAASPQLPVSDDPPRLSEPAMGQGRYLLITAAGGSFVAPRKGIAFNDADYNENLMGRIFNCKGYLPRHEYHRITLVRPATLRREGTYFVLDQPGEIELGEPQSDEP